MHLVNFETFNKLPAGTIFAPYIPCVLKERLAIKVSHGSAGAFGWCFNGVMPLEPWNLDNVFDETPVRATFEIYDGDSNDYRNYKQFLIFDECDIDRLINILKWAKNGCQDEDYDEFDEE